MPPTQRFSFPKVTAKRTILALSLAPRNTLEWLLTEQLGWVRMHECPGLLRYSDPPSMKEMLSCFVVILKRHPRFVSLNFFYT